MMVGTDGDYIPHIIFAGAVQRDNVMPFQIASAQTAGTR